MKVRTGAGVAGLLGALGGLWFGSRSVKVYDWRTQWTIPAPLPIVYKAMTSREAVREWWPDMELVEDTEMITPGRQPLSAARRGIRLVPPFRIHARREWRSGEKGLSEVLPTPRLRLQATGFKLQ